MFLFCVFQLPSLDIGGVWSKRAGPGEWYWYSTGRYRVGITMHLASVVPAGILMAWQFVPTIRYKAILFHRMNGYIIIVLIALTNISGLMIARHAFGGELSTQSGVGVLAIITTTGTTLAYYNIKVLQIEQHRAWMLRTWVYLGTIITTRAIMIIAAQVTTAVGDYHITMTCGELLYMSDEQYVRANFPTCSAAITDGRRSILDSNFVAVMASFGSNVEQTSASMRIGFGMALWLAIFLHVVAVEIYLALTPREAQRLRLISYKKQLAAGYENPGSAGLVIEKFGDAERWKYKIHSD